MDDFDKDTLFPINKEQYAAAKHELTELSIDYLRYARHNSQTQSIYDSLGYQLKRMKELMKKLENPSLKAKEKRLNNEWLKYAIKSFKERLNQL